VKKIPAMAALYPGPPDEKAEPGKANMRIA